jgi:thiamine biosynthesis lipoprotein
MSTDRVRQRTQQIEHCMGTVFTIAVRDPGTWDEAIAEVVSWLHLIDDLFSTFKPDSDISQIRNGQLTVAAADPLVARVLELCQDYERETDRYFTAHLPGGLDPTGLVKGWAIEHASELLHEHGTHNHAVNGGGDMQLAGEAEPGRPWRVGISDPHHPSKLLTTVTGRDIAVASSGTSERGEHIFNPRTGRAARTLASVTVVGPHITRADVYATAGVAMGAPAATWLEGMPTHHGLIVYNDGTQCRTSRFDRMADEPDGSNHTL